MKKVIFMMLMAFSAIVVNAQTAIETPKFFDNWYVGIGGQASTPLDLNKVFPVNGSAVLFLGKQLTPVFGVNVEDNVWFGSHKNGSHEFVIPHFDFNNDYHNIVRGNYVGLNGTVNLMNLLDGYTGTPRSFELQTVTGIGWFHMFAANQNDESHNDLAAKTGLNFLFNLGQSKAHGIYVQPAVLWNLTRPASDQANVAFNKNGAHLAVQLGYVYRFKTSNGTHHFKTYDIGAMNDEINRLKAELEKKPTEVIRTSIVEKRVVKNVESGEHIVLFAWDSAELDAAAKATLDKVSGTVKVDGYASPEGTAEHNKELSQRRADAVADYLRAKGVTVTEAVGCGVVGETSNRVAIVTVQ